MAPIRRYLRISQYSVLEVRIYLDNPADAQRWLLKASDPALPRVIEAVRPLVLPKLREENERTRKGGKKKGVKDVVKRDDFEVSIFLTELSTSHAILSKHKTFSAKGQHSDTGTKEAPVEVADGDEPLIRNEEEEDDVVELDKIPSARSEEDNSNNRENEGSDAESEAFGTQPSPPESSKDKRRKESAAEESDDKKKLGFKTTYNGFRIHGRKLCLVVKRKGVTSKGKQVEGGTGQAMMEEWISSTQAAEGMVVDD